MQTAFYATNSSIYSTFIQAIHQVCFRRTLLTKFYILLSPPTSPKHHLYSRCWKHDKLYHLKKIIILLIVFSTSKCLQAQQQLSKDQLDVQQTVINMFAALSHRDSLALKTYCSPEITLYEYGQVWNLDTLIQKAIVLNTSPDFKRINNFEFLQTKIDKNSAYINYRLNSNIIKDGKLISLFWLETVILNKEKSAWKIRHLHSTLIKRN